MRVAGRWALPWKNPHLAPGMRLGRYRVVRRLAVGGMAEIFLARALGLRGFEKLVVVKRLLPQYVADQNLVRMFLDEARLMATLNHANITQVHDVGEARGSYFFAMEYVHGEDLRTIQRVNGQRGVLMPIELAMGIIADAAAGLHHAHEKRGSDGAPLDIVHRDVSPSNVLVSYEGAVKLTDFGVAKWARQETRTRHGTLKGKCAYMSPEQCRGEPLDRRSDVFALGILLYELSTGTRLFQAASDFAILNQIVTGPIVPPSERRAGYPAGLERIVMRALARRREDRFATAGDVHIALEALAHQLHLAVTPVARARFMRELFTRKLDAWRAAEEAGRSLGQHLASLPEAEVIGLEEHTGGQAGTVVTGAGRTPAEGVAPDAAAADPPNRRRWVVLGVAGAGLVAAAGVSWRGRTPPAPAPTPAAPRAAAPGPAPTVVAEPVPTAMTPPPTRAPKPKRRAGPRARVEAPAPLPPPPKPTPVPDSTPAGDRVKIWDPDSVLLPK